MLVKCIVCQEGFKATPWQLKHGRKCCSQTCRVKNKTYFTKDANTSYFSDPRTKYLVSRLKEVQPLLDTGITYQEIAGQFGVTRQQVNLYARQLGYKRRENKYACEGQKHKVNGYIKVFHNGQWISEHRHIVETCLNRSLLPSEIVHHINGDRTDNRIENLQAVNLKYHRQVTRQCSGCIILKENRMLRAKIRSLEQVSQIPLSDGLTKMIPLT